MSLDHIWAGWRSSYISEAVKSDGAECVFCSLAVSNSDTDDYVIWRGPKCFAALNAYPYSSGHLMIAPNRHVGEIEELDETESSEIWGALAVASRAVKSAYSPDGMNVGINLGRVAGAGFPGHVHVHVVPRWNGDTNFMTTVADTRVLPEALLASAERLRQAWKP